MKESHRTKHLRLFPECPTRKTSETANSADAYVMLNLWCLKHNKISMKYFKIIFCLVILNSCSVLSCNGIKVQIKNDSSNPITNVKFYTSEKLNSLTLDLVKVKEDVTGFLSMSKNKFDGSYLLEFTRSKGKKEFFSNGYYTNGGSLDDEVQITITNDTAILNFKSREY